MSHHSPDIKATALKRMQPPINDSISTIASSMNIAKATLYHWRDTAKKQGQFVGRNQHNDPYDPQTKLNTIIQTAALNQAELSAYCREHGLYPELASQIRTTALSDNLLPEGCGQHPTNGALHEQKTPSQPLA